MGGVESKVNVSMIKKEVNANPVMLYTKTSCGFCVEAKKLLHNENIEYKEIDLDQVKQEQPKEFSGMVNGLVYTTRQTSVPQVFICGKFVGGFTELNKLKESKKLLEAVAECTGENGLIEK